MEGSERVGFTVPMAEEQRSGRSYVPRGSHSISFENVRTKVSNSHRLPGHTYIVSRAKEGNIFSAQSFYNLRTKLRTHTERPNRTWHGSGSVYMKPPNNSDGLGRKRFNGRAHGQHTITVYTLYSQFKVPFIRAVLPPGEGSIS